MIKAVIIMVIAIAFLLYKVYGYYKKNQLREKVKWCIAYNSFNNRTAENEMFNHIYHLQYELSVDKKYMIAVDDAPIVKGILKCYQQDLIQKYFTGALMDYSDDEKKQFVITLNEFLSKHQCDKEFNENQMYAVKDYKTYGTWGATSFSATYVLTDYAVTYNKLYYVSQLYFLKHYNIVDQDKLGVITANTIKEAIDNREFGVNNF